MYLISFKKNKYLKINVKYIMKYKEIKTRIKEEGGGKREEGGGRREEGGGRREEGGGRREEDTLL